VGRQDPYCVLTIGTKNFRSKTDTDGGKHPVGWAQGMDLPVEHDGLLLTRPPRPCLCPLQVWNEMFSFTGTTPDQVLKLEVGRKGKCRVCLSPP
jgi:hypothetical protein